MIDRADRDDLAARLSAAETHGRRMAPAGIVLDLDAGYAVQQTGRARRRDDGRAVVGHKVGLSSDEARAAQGVLEPVSGYLLADTVNEVSETCSLEGLLSPRLEVEIAFVLARPLSGPDLTEEDVVEATAELAPAFEIVDSRWEGGAPSAGLLVADNVSAARVVLGARTPGSSTSATELGALEVEAMIGDSTLRGSARQVYGHPARAVAWLVAELDRRGDQLHAGDVVMSGTFTPPAPVRRGDRVNADLGPLGSISTTFTG